MEGEKGALPFVDSKTRFDIPSGHGRTGRSDGSKSGHRRNQMNIPSLVIGLAAGLFIGILACILYRNKKAKDDKAKDRQRRRGGTAHHQRCHQERREQKREATLEAKGGDPPLPQGIREGRKGTSCRPAEAGTPLTAKGRKHRPQDRRDREGREALPRSTPLWTRRTKRSRSSSAARPRCSSASPVLRLTRPRST